MPAFDLRHIQCAKYVNTAGAITYTNKTLVGDAMRAALQMRFAEGRLYAESALAELMRKCTGGTISLGVKYIKTAAQKLMFGLTEKTRSITYTPSGGTSTTKSIVGLQTKKKTTGQYVGVSFYAPDMIDGTEKYTCVFLGKCLFGDPDMNLQTAGENIQFDTPTTTGEFLGDDSTDGAIKEVVIVDTEEEAIAWCDAVLS